MSVVEEEAKEEEEEEEIGGGGGGGGGVQPFDQLERETGDGEGARRQEENAGRGDGEQEAEEELKKLKRRGKKRGRRRGRQKSVTTLPVRHRRHRGASADWSDRFFDRLLLLGLGHRPRDNLIRQLTELQEKALVGEDVPVLHHLSDRLLQRIAPLQHQPGDDQRRGAADALAAVHEDPTTASRTGQRLLDKLRGGGKVLKERVDRHIERLNAHEGDAGVAVHTRKDLIVGLGGEDVVAGGVRRQDLQQLIWRHRGRGPPPPEHAAAH
ncbi:hypothetical protein TYRP_012650 [Tyrophagus putrescentiae]|nr:hypothetical protein TYRP_012650 [Tyrophagus putrescentiae]